MRGPAVKVRDLETGAEYVVSEARFRRTPELWERLGPVPEKPHTTVDEEAAKKQNQTDGQEADPTEEETS